MSGSKPETGSSPRKAEPKDPSKGNLYRKNPVRITAPAFGSEVCFWAKEVQHAAALCHRRDRSSLATHLQAPARSAQPATLLQDRRRCLLRRDDEFQLFLLEAVL